MSADLRPGVGHEAFERAQRVILTLEQAFGLEVPMDDLNDPRISAWRPQRRLLIPAPPGARQKLNKAQREVEREQEVRAEARAARLHLAGLTNAAVIIMGLVLAAVVVMLVLVLVGHH